MTLRHGGRLYKPEPQRKHAAKFNPATHPGDESYRELQRALMENPELGDVIHGTGGFRKARWHDARRAAVDQIMIGPETLRCDRAALMFFPTRRAYLQMTSNAAFQAASRHRRAALANHHMLHLDGRPFAE